MVRRNNIKRPYNSKKLSPKRYGPFKVVAKISHVAYQIKLPETWGIHDVFHASLLTPYKETEEHGTNFLEPPPELIEGEEEWEVEQILGKRHFGRGKKLQYPRKMEGLLTRSRSMGRQVRHYGRQPNNDIRKGK